MKRIVLTSLCVMAILFLNGCRHQDGQPNTDSAATAVKNDKITGFVAHKGQPIPGYVTLEDKEGKILEKRTENGYFEFDIPRDMDPPFLLRSFPDDAPAGRVVTYTRSGKANINTFTTLSTLLLLSEPYPIHYASTVVLKDLEGKKKLLPFSAAIVEMNLRPYYESDGIDPKEINPFAYNNQETSDFLENIDNNIDLYIELDKGFSVVEKGEKIDMNLFGPHQADANNTKRKHTELLRRLSETTCKYEDFLGDPEIDPEVIEDQLRNDDPYPILIGGPAANTFVADLISADPHIDWSEDPSSIEVLGGPPAGISSSIPCIKKTASAYMDALSNGSSSK